MIPSLSNQRIDSMFSAVRLFSDRTLMTSKCGKNKKKRKKGTRRSVSLMFSTHFDVFSDLVLSGRTASWDLFVLYS